jgi:putative DNA modification/repair radical SAM protein
MAKTSSCILFFPIGGQPFPHDFPLDTVRPFLYNYRTNVLIDWGQYPVELLDKLTILADAAKYDAACTSSGLDRTSRPGGLGSTMAAGCCHSFSADGRCVTLLKVLMTNACAYDCQYCTNRRSSDVPRAAFTPRELAELTVQFYRRNYIEGLFLSSAVLKNPDYTTERMIAALRLLREEYGFGGYIHAKAIPGTDPLLLSQLGRLADRLSVNIELPSEAGLKRLAPDKRKADILAPMGMIRDGVQTARQELAKYKHAPRFAPAGQSTQMIIGATPDSDRHIMRLTQGLYRKYQLKRVFYSAYIPVSDSPLLPAPQSFQPPLLREHRLYQADWLLRYYHFDVEELFDDAHTDLNPLIDPKCSWALAHMDRFPVEVNRADYETLLRVPGIGVTGARRILTARRCGPLTFEGLKRLRVILKRAQYFITCSGRMMEGLRASPDSVLRHLVALEQPLLAPAAPQQLSLFDRSAG